MGNILHRTWTCLAISASQMPWLLHIGNIKLYTPVFQAVKPIDNDATN